MLSEDTINDLKSLGIEASHSSDFLSGLKLMQLVSQVFYEGQNKALASKMRLSNDNKTGNNVLNINIILNHLKKDPNIQVSQSIRQLTAFSVIEQESAMIQLISWILSNKKQSKSKAVVSNEEMSPPREQQNQFENLYFVSSLHKKDNVLNDSLEEDNPQDRVVRKGSFKVLKPKASTASKASVDQNSQNEYTKIDQHSQSYSKKQPLRQQVLIQPQMSQQNEEKDDLNCRKTIPKMYQKPPLYRSKHKEQKTDEKKDEKKQPTPPTVTSRLIDREQILHNIEKINIKIADQERSLIQSNKEDVKPLKKSRQSSRKIFKLDIPETDDKRKKTLLEWLISINLLNANSAKFINQLHTICKDGVVFTEVVNYYLGRSKEMCYFKEPKRAAEMHSNYQKLFTVLGEQISFRSDLLHQYQYFIPQAQPNAFWSLLSSINSCFNRRIQPREPNINRFENSISSKIERQSTKKKSLEESISYREIKYHSAVTNKDPQSQASSVEAPRKETPTPNYHPPKTEVVKEKAISTTHCLVQNQQPIDENNKTDRGYKEMYLCKFKNMETPQKSRSFQNSSLSRSRLKASVGSSKKKDNKAAIPLISLEMQMRVLTYLEEYPMQEGSQQLFKDPFRNGVLLCQIVKRVLDLQCFACRKPKSIDDCRNNYMSALEVLKAHIRDFNTIYESYIEELVKGQKRLLYGIIWEIIRSREKQFNKHIRTNIEYNSKNSEDSDSLISWIRSVQRSYPEIGQFKIRNPQSLFYAIIGTDFLFQYSWFITGKRAVTPTYEHPINDVQKQSNLKKVLGYLVQNKIIRSDYLWKTKYIIKAQNNLIRELILDLVSHYNHLFKKQQLRSVNFVKYLKREDSDSRQKIQDKLETTMANQTLAQQSYQVPQPQPQIEVNWMRKLGFNGNLDITNGVLLCRLLSKLSMKTIEGVNDRPQSRAQSLINIRKAIKVIPKFKWDEYDIINCDSNKALQIYACIKQKFKHSYALKGI